MTGARIRRLAALLLGLCLACGTAHADTRVYYEIFPASFRDSDGDGRGDLRGIEGQLDYLEALGVGGVWLMPIHPSPSYHKYDVTDYLAVDPAYGSLVDFAGLADALHERDMTLLLDLVINHTSVEHPWFRSAAESLNVEPCGETECADAVPCRAHNPYVTYYHFSDVTEPGWHAVPGAQGWWYLGHFSPDMPDLNLGSDAVRGEIEDICAFWLAQGADGFRLDAVPHYFEQNVEENNAFVGWLMAMLQEIRSDVYVVGEVWQDAGTIARYYDGGISSLFNFPFSGPEGAIVSAIRGGKGESFARRAQEWQAQWSQNAGASDAPFLSNHDNARIAGTLMRKSDALKLAATMYLTLPGTPFLYYGEEIGMSGSGRDENKRLPMLWGEAEDAGQCLPPADADAENRALGTVREMLDEDGSLLRHYQALLALRRAHPALRTGTVEAIDVGITAVCALALTEESERLYVLHNLGREAQEIPWPGGAAIALYPSGEGAITYDGHTLMLPAQSSAVMTGA